jgi:hypothetical protein
MTLQITDVNLSKMKKMFLMFLKQFDVNEYKHLMQFLQLIITKYNVNPSQLFSKIFFFSSINFKYLIFFSILKGYLTNQTEDKEDHYENSSDDFTNNDSSDNNKASDNEKSKIKNLNSIKVIFFLIFIKKKRSVYI